MGTPAGRPQQLLLIDGCLLYTSDRYIDPAFNNLNLKITENPKAEDAIQAMKKARCV